MLLPFQDYENVVRLLLGPLQNPSKAYSVIHAVSIPHVSTEMSMI
jgi:hypothetical protein